jgi:hypothetical protein
MRGVFLGKLRTYAHRLLLLSVTKFYERVAKMSSTDQPIDYLMAEVPRQNAIAILLRKSLGIRLSYATSAMIEHFSVIETHHPNFACRILVVATGRTDQRTLNAFLEDFRILSSISPNVQPLQIDFKYIVNVPSHYVPDVSSLSTLDLVRDRKAVVVVLLFIIAFPDLNVPSGSYRLNSLEMITALHGSLKEYCLRIISDLASFEDIHMFETKFRMTRIWYDVLIQGNGDTNPDTIRQHVGTDSHGGQRAIRAETVEPEFLSSFKRQSIQDSSSLVAADNDEDEEEDNREDEAYDPNTCLDRVADKAWDNFIKNPDEEIYQAVLRSTRMYC